MYSKKFWLLGTASFLFFFSFNVIIPELPDYLSSIGGSNYKGYIIGLFTIMAGLSRPFSGKLADSVGRVPVMLVGAVVCMIVSMLYPLLAVVMPFLVLRAAHGLSTGFTPTGVLAYAADIIPKKRRGEAMGVLGVMNNVGSTSAFGMSSYITQHLGVNNLFYFSGSLALAAFILLLFLKETLPKNKQKSIKQVKIIWKDVYDKRAFLPAAIMFLTTISFGAIITLVPDYSVNIGLKNKGIYLMIMTFSSLLVRIGAGKISDRIGRLKTTIYGCAVYVISMIFLAQMSLPFFYISAFLTGVATGINSPTLFAWAVDVAKGVRSGRALSTLFIALEAGIGLGAFASAAVFANTFSNMSVVFYALAIINLLTVLFLIIQNKKQSSVNQIVIK